jgi:hypothetical protein
MVDETLRIAKEMGAPVPTGADFERVKKKAQRQFDSQQKIYEVAKSLGMKIVHVDVPLKRLGQISMGGSKPEEFWLERNENIAKNLTEKKKSGECDLTIGIFGEGHLRSVLAYNREWPIQNHLRKNGLKPITVSASWTAFDSYVPLWVPEECREAAQKLLPGGTFAISPKTPITPGIFDQDVKGYWEEEYKGKKHKPEVPIDCFDLWVTTK